LAAPSKSVNFETAEYDVYKAFWGYVLIRHTQGYETLLYAGILSKGSLRTFATWQGDPEEFGVTVEDEVSLRTMLQNIESLSQESPSPQNNLYVQSLRSYCSDKLWMVKFRRDDADTVIRHQLQDHLYERTQSHCIVFVRILPDIQEKELEELPKFFSAPLFKEEETREEASEEEALLEKELEELQQEEKGLQVRISCSPVVDPSRGRPAGEVLPGDIVWVHLKEDSVIYNLLRMKVPDFSGITEGVVENFVSKEGRRMMNLRISEGIEGQCVVREHVRIKTVRTTLPEVPGKKSSPEKVWFLLTGFILILLAFLVVVIKVL
jgi:hypothetical protein